MITPTVGRIVWYYEHINAPTQAAIITYVWNDKSVNLAVFDMHGWATGKLNVPLLQDSDQPPLGHCYAEWMPYQKGQAAKAEQLEVKLEEAKLSIGI